MSRYYEAIKEVFYEERRVLSRPEVISLIRSKYPHQTWVEGTIYSWLGGLTVNDNARCHRPSGADRVFLFNLGQGRRRVYDPEKDGVWICTDNKRAQRVDVKSMGAHVDELEPGVRLIAQQDLTDGSPGQEVLDEPDLLAVSQDGNYVVIGVEPGLATVRTLERVLGQIRQLQRQVAGDRPVRGIIIAYKLEDSLEYVVDNFPNVKFAQYDNERGFSYRWA